jgi:hypothetical protein
MTYYLSGTLLSKFPPNSNAALTCRSRARVRHKELVTTSTEREILHLLSHSGFIAVYNIPHDTGLNITFIPVYGALIRRRKMKYPEVMAGYPDVYLL